MAFVSLCEMSPVRTGTPLLLLCAKALSGLPRSVVPITAKLLSRRRCFQ